MNAGDVGLGPVRQMRGQAGLSSRKKRTVNVPEDFNPYQRWLQVSRVGDRPNYYEILQLDFPESDVAKIAHAADAAIAKVRSSRPGKEATQWVALLDELCLLKDCLLDPTEKAKYDHALGRQKHGIRSGEEAQTGHEVSIDGRAQAIAKMATNPQMFPPGTTGEATNKDASMLAVNKDLSAEPVQESVQGASAGRADRLPPGMDEANVAVNDQASGGNHHAPASHVSAVVAAPVKVPLSAFVSPTPVTEATVPSASLNQKDTTAQGVPVAKPVTESPSNDRQARSDEYRDHRQDDLQVEKLSSNPVLTVGHSSSVARKRRLRRRLTFDLPVFSGVAVAVLLVVGAGGYLWNSPEVENLTSLVVSEAYESPAPNDPNSQMPSVPQDRQPATEPPLRRPAPDKQLAPWGQDENATPEVSTESLEKADSPGNTDLIEAEHPATEDPQMEDPQMEDSLPGEPRENSLPLPAETDPALSLEVPAVESEGVPNEKQPLTSEDRVALQATLLAAREALSLRQFEQAETELAKAERLAKASDYLAQVERLADLTSYTKEFMAGFSTAYDNLEGGVELVYDEDRIVVVEVAPQQLIVRFRGANHTFAKEELPGGLVMAIHDWEFSQEELANLVFKAAYMASAQGATPEHLKKARAWWRQAEAANLELHGLPLVLEDDYDFSGSPAVDSPAPGATSTPSSEKLP